MKKKVKIPGYMSIPDFQKVHCMWAGKFPQFVKAWGVKQKEGLYEIEGMKKVAAEFITGEMPY